MTGTGGIADRNPLLHGLVGFVLHLRVERRLDRQAAALQQVAALLLRLTEDRVVLHDTLDVIAEVALVAGSRASVGGLVNVEFEVGVARFVVLLLRDLALLVHESEHGVAAFDGVLRLGLRIEGSRVLHNAGQGGRLLDIQVLRRNAPVALSRGLNAVDARGAGVVVDVEVAVEDLMLAVLVLHGRSQLRLAELAGVSGCTGALGGLFNRCAVALVLSVGVLAQHVLDVLLRQCRTALGVIGEQVVDHCAGDALQVDAAVFEEALILDGHSRLLHLLGDILEGDFLAVLPVEGRDLRAIGGEHAGLLGEGTLVEFGRQRAEQLDAGVGSHGGNADGGDRQSCTDNAGDDADGDELKQRRDLVGGF